MLKWVLVLHIFHMPVLMPDMDGECRGTLIESLIESQAWQPVLLGVRPNHDVDRGPIDTDDNRQSSFDGSQFGELAIVRDPSSVPVPAMTWVAFLPSSEGISVGVVREESTAPATPPPIAVRPVRILYCVWQV